MEARAAATSVAVEIHDVGVGQRLGEPVAEGGRELRHCPRPFFSETTMAHASLVSLHQAGAGSPSGIKGEELPNGARLIVKGMTHSSLKSTISTVSNAVKAIVR